MIWEKFPYVWAIVTSAVYHPYMYIYGNKVSADSHTLKYITYSLTPPDPQRGDDNKLNRSLGVWGSLLFLHNPLVSSLGETESVKAGNFRRTSTVGSRFEGPPCMSPKTKAHTLIRYLTDQPVIPSEPVDASEPSDEYSP